MPTVFEAVVDLSSGCSRRCGLLLQTGCRCIQHQGLPTEGAASKISDALRDQSIDISLLVRDLSDQEIGPDCLGPSLRTYRWCCRLRGLLKPLLMTSLRRSIRLLQLQADVPSAC